MGLIAPAAWRQSSIARYDSCPLSLKFDLEVPLRQLPGAMGTLGARGVLSHRAIAACINHMREHNERSMDVAMTMELLARIIAQREVCTAPGKWERLPAEDVVHLPIGELRWLRVLMTRWSYKHEFSIARVVDVERRLNADITLRGPGDQTYLRTITGMPDVLLAGPGDDEATLLDWKSGWAPPARKREPTPENPDPEDKLSDMGYVQQVVYGWLVLKNYPAINRVTEREWYLMADEDPVREASVERWEMERIEDVLAGVVSQMDAAIEEEPELRHQQQEIRAANVDAAEHNARMEARARREGRMAKTSELLPVQQVPYGRWFPVPGTHCGTCVGRRHCPIRKHFGVPDTLEEAQRLAREWHVAGEIRTERTPYLKGWIDEHGHVPIRHAKGRRVVGYKNGSRSLSLFEPPAPPPSEHDEGLIEVAKEAGVLSDG